MDVIDKQLGMANEQTLIELSNKGIYKRALKESKNMTLSAEKNRSQQPYRNFTKNNGPHRNSSK